MRAICTTTLKVKNYLYKVIFKMNLNNSRLFAITIKNIYLLRFFKFVLLFVNFCTYLKLNKFFGYLQVSNRYYLMI